MAVRCCGWAQARACSNHAGVVLFLLLLGGCVSHLKRKGSFMFEPFMFNWLGAPLLAGVELHAR